MRILFVDSDKKALDLEARRITSRQSAAIVFLHSRAEDAVKFAVHHDVGVIYTRSVLKAMSGQELIEKIRSFRPEAECHILLKDEEVPVPLHQCGEAPLPDGLKLRQESDEKSGLSQNQLKKKSSAGNFLCDRSDTGDQKGEEQRMTDQKLQSLNRKQLLEILIEQGKELEFLKSEYERDLEFLKEEHRKETDALKKELDKAHQALQKRELVIDEAGSIAAAALQLNGVFEAAQAASQQYIENIRSLNDRQKEICRKRDEDSRAEAKRLLIKTREKCEAMEAACQKKCAVMETEARQRSSAYWAEVSKRLQSFFESHQELKKLLNPETFGTKF